MNLCLAQSTSDKYFICTSTLLPCLSVGVHLHQLYDHLQERGNVSLILISPRPVAFKAMVPPKLKFGSSFTNPYFQFHKHMAQPVLFRDLKKTKSL